MLQLISTGRQSINAYRKIVGDEIIEELHELARPLKSLKVIHINATPYGGGVSELLHSLVPLQKNLGINAQWRIIFGDEVFFKITKTIHDALQGEKHHLSSTEKKNYLNHNYISAQNFNPLDYDVVIIHDPQPAAIIKYSGKKGATKWIWRCHIDTSEPNDEVWQFFKDFVLDYDKTVFTMADFVPFDFPNKEVAIIPPGIDPLSPKNLFLDHAMASKILSWLGMFPGEPFITQVSRFDKWKDPFGVIKAYQIAKEHVQDIHLAMVGSMALDDPTSWEIYSKLIDIERKDPDLHVFTNLTGVSSIEVNAFQRLSKAIVQKSIKEGFGLVVSEALWKETPVIAKNAGGIPLQIDKGGFLIDTVEECASRIIEILENDEKARLLAKQGHDNIVKNFLITRMLKDELILLRSLVD
jgi:trehalose synthase